MESVHNIVLVTGLSGAGKTTAMGVLEDMGYRCLDGYPVELISQFSVLIADQHSVIYQDIALSVTSVDYPKFLEAFRNLEANLRTLYLDADLDVLLLRYKYNRRTHPLLVLNKATSLEEAIAIENDELSVVKESADVIIDTSRLSGQDLRKKIITYFSVLEKPTFTISLVSFGYRYGLPLDADLVLDVRFLSNPYWKEELRLLNGNDQPVYDYVISDSKTEEYLKYLVPFLDYSLKQYQLEGKSHFTIGIGCTGGQHRSVSIVNWLYTHYSQQYACFKEHREVRAEA